MQRFMKRFMKRSTLIPAIVLCHLCAAPALAADLPILLDGVNVSLEPNPYYAASNIPPSYAYERLAREQGGTACVPLRFLAETFNTQVDYAASQITLTDRDTRLELTIGSTAATKNGRPLTLPAADGQPLRDVSLIRSSGAAVLLYDWQTDTCYAVNQSLWRQAEPIIERNLQFKEFTGSDAP